MAVISEGKASKSALGSMKYVEFEKYSTHHRAIFTVGIECSDHYLDAHQDFRNLAHAFGNLFIALYRIRFVAGHKKRRHGKDHQKIRDPFQVVFHI